MKGSRSQDYSAAWKDTNSWDNTAAAEEWPVDNWGSTAATEEPPSGSTRYRALYEFVARNQDEISFQPGDIIMVKLFLSFLFSHKNYIKYIIFFLIFY